MILRYWIRLHKKLGLSEKAKRIFAWKFFAGESFVDWPGPESRKELYETYKSVFNAVMDKKDGRLLFSMPGIDS